MVVCGLLDLTKDQVRAPMVVVEGLSRSTEDHDRGAKWVAYRDVESLQHSLLVGQDARRVEVYSREPQGLVAAGPRASGPDPSARDRR